MLPGVRLHALVVEAVRVPPWGHCFCPVANPTPGERARRKSCPGGPSETESDPQGSDEAEPFPWDRTSRSPRLGVGRGGNLIFGVGAHASGSDEVETSSSESDEAWLGPWGSDEVAVASLTIG